MVHSQRKFSRMAALLLSFVLIFTALTSAAITTTSAAELPPAPDNLRLIDKNHNSITIAWDPVDDIDPYAIGYWLSPGGWASGVEPKTIGGLEPDTEYTISVSVNIPGAPASTLQVRTDPADPDAYPTPPLIPPHHLRITEITPSAITLNWTGSPGANGYDISVNDEWFDGVWDGSNTYTFPIDEQTVAGSVYSFAVSAQHLPAVSAPSNMVTITWGELAAPQDLSIVTATRTTASLGWAPTPGATSYDIVRDNVIIGTSESNRFVATGLTEGERYSFQVIARNNLWQSPASSEVSVVPGSNYNIITYYTSWSIYDRDFLPSDIDVSQITHINYAFSDLCWKGFGSGGAACQNEQIPLQDRYVFDGEMVIGDRDADLSNFEALGDIRDQNPHLHLIVSVGGWSWSKNFSNMAATEETRRAFANSVVSFLREYRLDGLDIDWEYPVEGGEEHNSKRPEDKVNFGLLMKTVREALDAAGAEDGKYYLLTIASAQMDSFIENADLVQSSQYLDFINIMTYDYSGSWSPLAHHNAPLYYDLNHPTSTAQRDNAAGSVAANLNSGIPHYKLVMGLPFYGKGWLGCPPDGQYQTCEGGTPGPREFGTWENYTFDFSDIEDHYINQNGYIYHWNNSAKVPYLYNAEKRSFITYDDQQTMMYKASLVKSLDIAGVMSWEISGDRNRTLSTQLAHDLPIDGIVNESALASPAQLAVKSKSTNSIRLTWEPVNGATGYDIFTGNAWAGFTTNTEFEITSLSPNTHYNVHVVSIQKAGNLITAVSAASDQLSVTTPAPSTPSMPAPLWPITPESDSSLIGDAAAIALGADMTRVGDTMVARLHKTDAALASIRDAASALFQVVIDTDLSIIEAAIPIEVIQAIANKGNQAILSILTPAVEYRIPITAFPLGENVTAFTVTIQLPQQNITERFEQLTQADGLKIVVHPLEFLIKAHHSNNEATIINDFGTAYASRIWTISESDMDVNKASGVVYWPETNTYRHVPTLFTSHPDGTVTAELKRNGNSMYAIVEADIRFQDVTAVWAKQDIEQAASKFIVSGLNDDQFGFNQKVTRAEFISMMVHALGVTPATERSSFQDVNERTAYAIDIATAEQLGLIRGKSNHRFDPSGFITRQEMAVMLGNAMRFTGAEEAAKLELLNLYEDRLQISAYAKHSLALMVQHHIMVGTSKATLDPLASVTKAQAAVATMRMLRTLNFSN